MCKRAEVKQIEHVYLEHLSRADWFKSVIEFSLLSAKVSPKRKLVLCRKVRDFKLVKLGLKNSSILNLNVFCEANWLILSFYGLGFLLDLIRLDAYAEKPSCILLYRYGFFRIKIDHGAPRMVIDMSSAWILNNFTEDCLSLFLRLRKKFRWLAVHIWIKVITLSCIKFFTLLLF